MKCRLADFPLLRLVDRFGWPTGIRAMFAPSFDFDKNDATFIPRCDDIDFAEWASIGMFKNDVASTLQEQKGQAFPVVPHRFVGLLFWVGPGTSPVPPQCLDAHACSLELSREVTTTQTPLAVGAW
jgi:hypothetical protein